VARRKAQGRGLVEVYTGNGRGKTSAAMGIALRAHGQGLRVCVIQFMKGSCPYGEQRVLASLPNVTLHRFGRQEFCDPREVKPEEREEAEKALAAASEAVFSGDYDLVVLDEVNVAASWGLVAVDQVVDLVKSKPGEVTLILTGRYADPTVIELADLVTEMVEVKHPYRQGRKARRGFEY